MKLKKKLKPVPCAATPLIALLFCFWYWQANHAERVRIINVPQWMAGGSNVSYSVAIGKSQIKPYGTPWRKTVGDGWESNIPIYNEQDLERYLARQNR